MRSEWKRMTLQERVERTKSRWWRRCQCRRYSLSTLLSELPLFLLLLLYFFFLNSEWTHNHWFASSNSQRYFNARCAFGGHEADEEKCVCAVVWSFSGLFKKKNYFLGRNGLVNNFSLLQQIKYDCDSCLFKAMIGNVASIMHFQIIFTSWVSCTWYFMYSIDFIHLIIMIHYCYYFRIKIVGSG